MRWRRCLHASRLPWSLSSRPALTPVHGCKSSRRALRTREAPRPLSPGPQTQSQFLTGAPLPSFVPGLVNPAVARRPGELVSTNLKIWHDLTMARHAALRKDLERMLGLIEHNEAAFEDVIFVCIDCEAYEGDQTKITEIGVAVFDTRFPEPDSIATFTGDWSSRIQHAHYRPVEHADLRNRRFVRGNEDGFRFGRSTWISKDDGSELMRRLFNDPARLSEIADFSVAIPNAERNIVLVGHGLKNDLIYLRSLGFDYDRDAKLVAKADTAVLAGGTKKTSIGLSRLLYSLNIRAIDMHNAGNDAAYTLLAMLILILKEAKDPGSVALGLANVPTTRKLPRVVSDGMKTTYQHGGTASKTFQQADQTTATMSQTKPSTAFPGKGDRSAKRSVVTSDHDLKTDASSKRAKAKLAGLQSAESSPA